MPVRQRVQQVATLWYMLVALALGACGGDDGGGDDGGGPVDGEPAELSGITAAHNQVRSAHGVGPLTWDNDLAAIAQTWANQCIDVEVPSGLLDHNAGRSDTYAEYVGENIYASSGFTPSGPDAVNSWAHEESSYTYSSNTCAGTCGHYTQVVWATTTKVGCAYHVCASLQFPNAIVCDYAPGGNVNGQKPY